MRRRILIIGAKNIVDIIRADKLVEQFEREDRGKYNVKPGRHHLIAYGGPDQRNAAVWYNATQTTVHFGD